jgi:hypothetical protein
MNRDGGTTLSGTMTSCCAFPHELFIGGDLCAKRRVDDPAYSAPVLLRIPALLLFAGSGLGVAWALQAGLGDATWSVSTGLGACMAAAVYEVGRPDRLSADEAVALEGRWQEFGAAHPFHAANMAST